LRVAADIGLRAHYGNHVHRRAKVINLMDALRRSVEAERGGSAKRQAPAANVQRKKKSR
jgi:non-homologous end joining protein Ku